MKEKTRTQENNRKDQTEYIRKKKPEAHNTGSPNFKPREGNKRRTDTKNGKIRKKWKNSEKKTEK